MRQHNRSALGRRITRRLGSSRIRRFRKPALVVLVVCGLAIVVLNRVEAPPRNPNDLCDIFEQRPDWFASARESFAVWGVPEAVQMSLIYQESGFRARARPRRKILWVFPGPRRSSAYGYAQALDSTWRQFQESTGRDRAWRNRFDDVTHFVGWYGGEIHRLTGISKKDAYRLYLAYHEGPAGYTRGSHHQKNWLLKTARKVEARAAKYQQQYSACEERLRNRWRWLGLGFGLLVVALGWVLWRLR